MKIYRHLSSEQKPPAAAEDGPRWEKIVEAEKRKKSQIQVGNWCGECAGEAAAGSAAGMLSTEGILPEPSQRGAMPKLVNPEGVRTSMSKRSYKRLILT